MHLVGGLRWRRSQQPQQREQRPRAALDDLGDGGRLLACDEFIDARWPERKLGSLVRRIGTYGIATLANTFRNPSAPTNERSVIILSSAAGRGR
jgi:hypothetical protein